MYTNISNEKFRDIISLGDSVISIEFDRSFNQPIDHLIELKNLKAIVFGYRFNQSIEPLAQCKNLEEISFGKRFNQSIEPLKECKKLKKITVKFSLREWTTSYKSNIEPFVSLRKLILLGELPSLEIVSFYGQDFHPLDISSLLKYIPTLEKAILDKDSVLLDTLFSSGFPVPNGGYIDDGTVSDLGYKHTESDNEFLNTFSKYIEYPLNESSDPEIVLYLHYWSIGNYHKIQDLTYDYHTTGHMKGEIIDLTTEEMNEVFDDFYVKTVIFARFYEVFHNLIASTRPFTGKTYLFRGLDRVIIENPIIGQKTIWKRFASAGLAYDESYEFLTDSDDAQMLLLEVDQDTPGCSLVGFGQTEILLPDGMMWEIKNIIPIVYGRLRMKVPIIHLKFVKLLTHEELIRL